MALGWASQESSLNREAVLRVVVYIPYPKEFEAAPVCPKDVIKY